jgi:hypothetical protein
MKLPQRVPQHISETSSFKLFSSQIPDNWILREMTERDYGFDCYLEIVSDNNEVTGRLAFIQLKSRDKINWTSKNYYNIRDIKISSTNYFYHFPVPVFIFLADIKEQELFFLSVHKYIRSNFFEYSKQENFNYQIQRTHQFQRSKLSGRFRFEYEHLQESYRQQFENELLFFLSNLEHFQEFQSLHYNLDFHLGVEDSDLVYFEAMHRNYKFLCDYLEIKSNIPSLSKLKKASLDKFQDTFYELHEHDLSLWMEDFEELTKKIIKGIKGLFEIEKEYWLINNSTVHRYISDMDNSGNFR